MSDMALFPLRIGVSACLIGREVRYDGGHKLDRSLADELGWCVEWIPVCPEVEIGLGVPRPPLRLERAKAEGAGGAGATVLVSETGEDLTAAMLEYAERRVGELAGEVDGFVLKQSSPSCGLEGVRIWEGGWQDGEAFALGRGAFAKVLVERCPLLPVEDEGRLEDAGRRESFLVRIVAYRRWRIMRWRGVDALALRTFHERHALLLSSRSEERTQALGELVRKAGEIPVPAERYLDGFTRVLAMRPTRRGHIRVLRGLAGGLAESLTAEEREGVERAIDEYRHGLQSLLAPLTLVRRHVRRLGLCDLEKQVYLAPDPRELRLLGYALKGRAYGARKASTRGQFLLPSSSPRSINREM